MVDRNTKFSKLIGITLGLLVAHPLSADTLKDIVDSNEAKVEAASKSQKTIDGIHTETDTLLEQYRNTNSQIDALQIYNDQLRKQLVSQQQIVTELDDSIARVAIIERQLPGLMQQMLDTLQEFVDLDAPFHRAERQQRIVQLHSSMARADISLAEKFRQLLEAYKIENEYGRKIDSYEDTVEIDGEPRKVNILRVGRVALLYQTRDRMHSGVWDRKAGQWSPLDNAQYRNAVVRGLRIARNQAAIELLQLPVPTLGVAQ
jgi:transcriptional regulator